VLQYMDVRHCICFAEDDGSAAGNMDVVAVAASTTCPRQLIRRRVANSYYNTA